jgi:hypothetical protein
VIRMLSVQVGAILLTLGVIAVVEKVFVSVPASAELAAQSVQKSSLPSFRVDPYWPKPLPNDWLVGNVVGVAADSHDNIWIVQRPNSQQGAEKTPPAIEFDPAGNVLRTLGPPGDSRYEWGNQPHGIYVDYKDNVWVGFGGGLPYVPKEKSTYGNAHFLKFGPDGKFLLQIGVFGTGLEGSNSTKYLGQPTDVWVDPKTDEVYISDGYTNHRVVVFNANTGEYKRHWGAYGHKPDDGPLPKFDRNGPPRQQFDTPHCIVGTNDGLLYVCDRGNQRIQVFKTDGTFVKEALVGAKLSDGTVAGAPWDIAVSRDPQQRYLFVVDGSTHRVYTVVRESLEVVDAFGRRGRWVGEFESPHSIANDSKGNLFVAETLDGRRIQKFNVQRTASRKTTAE